MWPLKGSEESKPQTGWYRLCAKHDKAVACLTKDREALLAFFDFPAEHWEIST